MENTLYLECYSGISGDMTVAALLDLGADETVLRKALGSLSVEGFEVEIGRVKKSGLDACDFRVLFDAAHENHDHDMAYLHGHEHPHDHEHLHDHEHPHGHEHLHGHEHPHGHEHLHDHEHPHVHRGLPEIRQIIDSADMSESAKATAKKIFGILADAESKAHGVPVEEVHFHEVGAVDSIVDIVAVAVCLDNLSIREVIVPELYEGRGCIRCQHGIIPVPVPAVVNVVQAHELKLHLTEVEGELVTPTGAAIVAAIRTKEKLPKHFTVQKIGIGAGKRNYESPGILRAMMIEETGTEKDRIFRLETNIDDCSGEAMGYVMKRLLKAGAKDVHFIPVFMKKNRPAYELVVLCEESEIPEMEQIIFEETTTIGIRRTAMERTILKREQIKVRTELGEARVKRCMLPNGILRCYPEYEDVKKIAKRQGISYEESYRQIRRCAEENREDPK